MAAWWQALIERVDEYNENSDKVIDILKHMVAIEPRYGFSAMQRPDEEYRSGLSRLI